jgi:hypothetical protein
MKSLYIWMIVIASVSYAVGYFFERQIRDSQKYCESYGGKLEKTRRGYVCLREDGAEIDIWSKPTQNIWSVING